MIVKIFCSEENKLRKLHYTTRNVLLDAGQVALLKKEGLLKIEEREEETETEDGIRERKQEYKYISKIKEILTI
jgi:hypothetical protein